MNFLRYRRVFSILLLAALAGCTQQQNSQDLKEQTAQATAEMNRDAQALAAGISESWRRDASMTLQTGSPPNNDVRRLPCAGVRQTSSLRTRKTGAPSLLLAIGKRLRCKPQPAP
jgi:hypothetical protein